MALPVQSIPGLTWQNYVSDTNSLVAPIDLDFTTYSQISVSPTSTYGTLGIRTATGVVIDNLLSGSPVVVNIGPLRETIPPYSKQTIALGGTTNAVQFNGSLSVIRATFFYGTFQGSSSGANYYQAQVQAGLAVATGMVYMFAGQSAAIPVGYLECDGAAVSRSTYSGLFMVIGTLYGAGDGSTTFNLPKANGRAIIGAGTSDEGSVRAVASKGGAEKITITATQMPVHTHALTDPGHGHTLNDPGHGHALDISNVTGGNLTNLPYIDVTTGPNVSSNYSSFLGNRIFVGGAWQFYDPSQTANPHITIRGSTTGITINGATTGITIKYAGGLGGTGDGSNAVTQPTPTQSPFLAMTFIIKT